jgi:putative component of membrane protein insertase Oxa1/YidC/SpoIIIJ protein YidD
VSVARICTGLVRIADDFIVVPARCEAIAARLAIVMIEIYRRVLSRFHRRTCLFLPSCSSRGIATLREFGWTRGIAMIRAQLDRCGGDYMLLVSTAGQVTLLTGDGKRFAEAEISPAILARSGHGLTMRGRFPSGV